ncbi:arylformamidase [Fredinandcohnia sp. QZ13]|uniref:arylformamidase n=1 Tax=Fredinandcohnia sp. QZ13 TaxID=3073144 RepID=UPI0028535C50|nr:arylformamidase [Fredinandcohnia sp. QZ13]MDR4888279.1 arylformamidase [Fredinandcohnia sp. QZ13]
MKIIDISQPLSHTTKEWPNDTPFEYKLSWSIKEASTVNVGKITTSTHIGTHIDAPFHFDDDGKKVHELELDIYVGKARVIEVSGKNEIGIEDLNRFDLRGVKRLLIRTNSWENRSRFPTTITSLNPKIAPFLAEIGIQLIGVDTPSVDQLDSKELQAHHQLHKHGIYILEGIVLDVVEPGDYELIALPLPIEGADGSPVRAVLKNI